MNREVLKARGLVLAEMVQQEATIVALRTRVAALEAALQEPSYNLVMKIELKIRELAIRDQQDIRVFATELANIAIDSLKETVEA